MDSRASPASLCLAADPMSLLAESSWGSAYRRSGPSKAKAVTAVLKFAECELIGPDHCAPGLTLP